MGCQRNPGAAPRTPPDFRQGSFGGLSPFTDDFKGFVELYPGVSLKSGLIRTSADIALKFPSSFCSAWIEFMMISNRLGMSLSLDSRKADSDDDLSVHAREKGVHAFSYEGRHSRQCKCRPHFSDDLGWNRIHTAPSTRTLPWYETGPRSSALSNWPGSSCPGVLTGSLPARHSLCPPPQFYTVLKLFKVSNPPEVEKISL